MSKDSRAYIPKLEELGRYWGHIQGYGPLIDHYMKLLVTSGRVFYPPTQLIPPEPPRTIRKVTVRSSKILETITFHRISIKNPKSQFSSEI